MDESVVSVFEVGESTSKQSNKKLETPEGIVIPAQEQRTGVHRSVRTHN